MILRHLFNAIGIVVFTSALAAGQAPADGAKPAGAPPPPMKNLQVLSKDTPQPQVVAIMRTYNSALGVECGHCHVWTKPGDPTNDMASDEKPAKQIARLMMHMTGEINTKLAASVKRPTGRLVGVECGTCHRGAAIPPAPPPPAPAATAPPKPAK